jgi:hypothetical protein
VKVQLYPTADSYVRAGAPSTNFGSSPSLYARGGATPAVSYLRFKLPSAPAGKQLTAATLRLRTTTVASAGSKVSQKVTLADDTWTGTGLTWKNRPATRQQLGTVVAGTVRDTPYTPTLQSTALTGRLGTTVSMAVVGGGDDDLWFGSVNNSKSYYRPVLTLTFK